MRPTVVIITALEAAIVRAFLICVASAFKKTGDAFSMRSALSFGGE